VPGAIRSSGDGSRSSSGSYQLGFPAVGASTEDSLPRSIGQV
jgi:hypothetical protein